MLVKELRKKLKGLPDHMDVFIKQENTEFPLSLVAKAEVYHAPCSEEPDGKALAWEDVLLVTDEV